MVAVACVRDSFVFHHFPVPRGATATEAKFWWPRDTQEAGWLGDGLRFKKSYAVSYVVKQFHYITYITFQGYTGSDSWVLGQTMQTLHHPDISSSPIYLVYLGWQVKRIVLLSLCWAKNVVFSYCRLDTSLVPGLKEHVWVMSGPSWAYGPM